MNAPAKKWSQWDWIKADPARLAAHRARNRAYERSRARTRSSADTRRAAREACGAPSFVDIGRALGIHECTAHEDYKSGLAKLAAGVGSKADAIEGLRYLAEWAT